MQLLPVEAEDLGGPSLAPVQLWQLRQALFIFPPPIFPSALGIEQVVQHPGQAVDQGGLRVGVGLAQTQPGHWKVGGSGPVLHVNIQLAVGQAAPRQQRLGEAEDVLLHAPRLLPVLRLAPLPRVLDKIAGIAAVCVSPAHELGAVGGGKHIALLRNGLQPPPAAVEGPALDHPAGEGQQPALTHHSGAHGPPLRGDKIALLPQVGPAADLDRAPALGTKNGVPVLIDHAPLHLGVALGQDEAVALLPSAVVVQVLMAAAGAIDPHHPPLFGLGPLVQQILQPPALHPLLLIEEAVGVQLLAQRLRRPGEKTPWRRPRYQSAHVLHTLTPRSRPDPAPGGRPRRPPAAGAGRRTPAGCGRTPPG